ncbi:hypothetical protein PS676_02712 [Pseudomonas fluorescens]|jgi:hypothetical protein|nr:hypothetical protein PS676_02712 [Pseudomonas fluorescens]
MRGAETTDSPCVGAGLPAMDVNDNACFLDKRVIVNTLREQARSYKSDMDIANG